MAAVVVLASGCAKQRYGWTKSSTTTLLETAKSYQADQFPESKSSYEAADKAYKDAEQQFGSNPSDAVKTIGDAKRQAQEAVNQARSRFSDKMLQQAENSLRVASINDGQSENPKIFADVEKLVADARDRNSKQKYDDAIKSSIEADKKVSDLLARLKNTSENRLNDLRSKLKDLEKAEAAKYLPNPIIKANDSIGNIEGLINEKRDYKQAVVQAGAAISDVEAAIIETKKRHSEADLRALEDKISEAIAEEAPIHTPDALRTVQETFEGILQSFYEKQYDSVLVASVELRKRVDELVTMARIESTKDKINQVRTAITRLKDQAVEQYLPGRVKIMEELLAKSEDLFNNNDFDGAKFTAGNADLEYQRINAAFDSLAEKAIAEATAAASVARQTFDRMGQVFGPTGVSTDRRLEAQRQVESSRLEANLRDAQGQLDLSSSDRGQKEFKKSIELAKQAQAGSEAVTNGTYRVVAQHTLAGVQDQISEMERQGAGVHAARSLSQSKALVDQCRRLIEENQNREAVELAARGRASVENVRQELARQASVESARSKNMVDRLEGRAPAPGRQGGRILLMSSETPGGGSDLDRFAEAPVLDRPIVVAQAVVAETGQGGLAPVAQSSDRSLNLAPLSSTAGTINSGGAPTVSATTPDRPLGMSTQPSRVGDNSAMAGPRVGFVAASAMEPATAVSGGGAADDVASAIQAIRDQVDGVLLDDRRVRDIRKYQPQAIETARQRLSEATAALASQQFLQAIESARAAQTAILEAEKKAAATAARSNLKTAANRINLAQAASAVTFAPAQVYESLRLYEQAETFMKNGDPMQARDAAAQALTAAEDARLYNVNKARDLANLSIRYGGWEAASPELVNAYGYADQAEKLLNQKGSATEGQCLAQMAVLQAQAALDRARDWTYQERLDRIYEALHSALRAGANYFNVTEIRHLIDEINTARLEYSTRNFDAVEVRLRDVEAGLARVIETTPQVLDQNIEVQTEKLNALVLAGAQELMSREVDDVKTALNQAAITFRAKDYYGAYSNMKRALELTDKIENRLQEQVYFDSVTELFAQLDAAFHDFSPVLERNRTFIKKLATSAYGVPRSIQLTQKLNPNDFRDRITDIYLRGVNLKPPTSQEAIHVKLLTVLEAARIASINFQKLYLLDQMSAKDANEVIDVAFAQIEHAKRIRSEVQYKMVDPQAKSKVLKPARLYNNF